MSAADTTPVDLAEFIAGLPKCELHLHLEGTLEPELKLELAERNGIELAETTVAEVEATYEFDSLASFLAVYYPAMQVLVTADDFRDLALRLPHARPRRRACATSRCSSTRRRTPAAACRSTR